VAVPDPGIAASRKTETARSQTGRADGPTGDRACWHRTPADARSPPSRGGHRARSSRV
ncbi:MAG: hypothetical protein AVDCRST_MAG33-1151, partial [uncultured Thermomicrobiales bacterium]